MRSLPDRPRTLYTLWYMKSRRFKQGYRRSASRPHKLVGDALRNSPVLKGFNIYQEYPVDRVNPSYPSGREKFDWVITTLKVVIEVHGQQHYQPVCFGGISSEAALERYQAQVQRDQKKREAAEGAGYRYIVIPHTDTHLISSAYLLNLIKDAIPNISEPKLVSSIVDSEWKRKYSEKKQRDEDSGRAAERREQARQARREQYLRSKKLRARMKEEKTEQHGGKSK